MAEASNRKARQRAARDAEAGKLQAAFRKIRELELELAQYHTLHPDPVIAEAEARLGLVRPVLTSLVADGQAKRSTNINGSSRAFRNFGLHTELGCGLENLPKEAADAKRRVRGSRKSQALDLGSDSSMLEGGACDTACENGDFTNEAAGSASDQRVLDNGSFNNRPSTDDDMRGDGDSSPAACSCAPGSFNWRFQEAIAIVNTTLVNGEPRNALAPGVWSQLNRAADPFVPGAISGNEEPAQVASLEDDDFYEQLRGEIIAENSSACDKAIKGPKEEYSSDASTQTVTDLAIQTEHLAIQTEDTEGSCKACQTVYQHLADVTTQTAGSEFDSKEVQSEVSSNATVGADLNCVHCNPSRGEVDGARCSGSTTGSGVAHAAHFTERWKTLLPHCIVPLEEVIKSPPPYRMVSQKLPSYETLQVAHRCQALQHMVAASRGFGPTDHAVYTIVIRTIALLLIDEESVPIRAYLLEIGSAIIVQANATPVHEAILGSCLNSLRSIFPTHDDLPTLTKHPKKTRKTKKNK